jgi:hypothetical protein
MKHGNGKRSQFPVPKRETGLRWKRLRNETSGSKCGNVFYNLIGKRGLEREMEGEKEETRLGTVVAL